MPLTEGALNGMADWLAGVAPYLALHSADPGAAGDNETPAARVAATWPKAADGGRLMILDKLFAGGEPLAPVTHIGLWSDEEGGTFWGSGQLGGDQLFNANGTYNIVSVVINGVSP
jgi:hypothetical protein